MGNTNFPNSRIYSGHYAPVLVDFNFIVDATDAAGYGCKSLKGAYVSAVYMHTSATPAVSGLNPAVGYFWVKLNQNFNSLLYANVEDKGTVTGSNVAVGGSALTAGVPYVISVVGTSTTAEWVAVGVPIGVTPAVGVAFIAIATGAGSGSGQVNLATATGSGITKYDQIGIANTTIAPVLPKSYSTAAMGSWLLFRALAATNSSTTTFVAAAPALNTKISVQLLLSNTSITLGGQ